MATHKGFLAVAAPSRKGACPGACAPAPAFVLLPFSSITIFRAGDYAMNYFEYQSGRPCVFVVTSSFAICHVSVFTIIITSRSARVLLLSLVFAMFLSHGASWYRRAVEAPPPARAGSATPSGPQTTRQQQQTTPGEQVAPELPAPHKTTCASSGGGQGGPAMAGRWLETRPAAATSVPK